MTTTESIRYRELAELPFVADYPTSETSRTLDDELFFQRAVQTYLWTLPAINMYAMKEIHRLREPAEGKHGDYHPEFGCDLRNRIPRSGC